VFVQTFTNITSRYMYTLYTISYEKVELHNDLKFICFGHFWSFFGHNKRKMPPSTNDRV